MSRENVELVQRIYAEDLLNGTPERFLAVAAQEVEYVNPPEAVDPGVRRGATEVARALRNLAESFDFLRHEVHELFDAGDAVVASVSCCTRSRGSAAEVIQAEVHTWTLRDGLVVRFEWGRDLAAALEAVGLRAQTSEPAD
jgi:ketosteroid isomerase-like protein